MPVTLTYPGVYIEEVPSGVRTITGVATSITAFVGRALRCGGRKTSRHAFRAMPSSNAILVACGATAPWAMRYSSFFRTAATTR